MPMSITSKIYNVTKGINDALQSPTKIGNAANNGIEYVTKLTGATTGAAGLGKGTIDALEALACQDKVCLAISCIGTAADALQICASFVPGPNVTALITTPVSICCKTAVWACKKATKLPWDC